jgi:glycosyltransferase involved in cell wall biosynthesis
VDLALLGAPGRDSESARMWLALAREHGLEQALSFSGMLPAQELSDALSSCDMLLFADSGGPSSRKGSLAAALASGRAVVAIDGRRTWGALAKCDAAQVVAPNAASLAEAIGALLGKQQRREDLGARGRTFAEQQMSTAVTARAFIALLADLPSERASR